nr:hypothetical protein [Tanacetum cinerariifolium]
MTWAVTVETCATRRAKWMVSVTCGTLGYRTHVFSPNRVSGCSKVISSPSPFVVISYIPILARFSPILSLLRVLLIDLFLRASSLNVPAICTAFWLVFGFIAATIPRIYRARPYPYLSILLPSRLLSEELT